MSKAWPFYKLIQCIVLAGNERKDSIGYQVRTERGSSGAPVFVTFDDNAVVVAIHTESGSKDDCNYGTLLWPFLKLKYSKED